MISRVSRPELKAMIAFINSYEPESGSGMVFTEPIIVSSQVLLLECKDGKYKDTLVFDMPKEAKEFLIKRMNTLIAEYGLKGIGIPLLKRKRK